MQWSALLNAVSTEPVFGSAMLHAGTESDAALKVQLVRWVRSGKLLQLRRGLYALAPPYRKTDPHPFLVANHLRNASYVSVQSALQFHGMIPEYVPTLTSVTTVRPENRTTPLGRFQFRHIATSLFHGYQRVEVAPQQFAFVAVPEKALLDLVYLTPGGDTMGFLSELRLQNLDAFSTETMNKLVTETGKPKLRRAARAIQNLVTRDQQEATRNEEPTT